MNKKGIIITALCALMAIALSACGDSGTSGGDGNTKEYKTVTFCLDWTPNTNHTGVYVAQAMGYYEEAGLEVSIVQPPEDGAATMCASGEAQFAVEYQDTLAAAFDMDAPLGVTAVAAVIDHNTSGIMSRKGDGIDSPKGMSGRTYATWQSPIELAMIKNVVGKDGGDFDSIKMIPNNITDEPAALEANQTDSVWVYEGWGMINADVEGVDVDFWKFSDISPELDYYTPVIIANSAFLAEDPDTARAFIDATKKGYQYAMEHPDKAADMLIAGDTTGSLKGSEELVRKSQEWLADRYADDASDWGKIDGARWDAFYKWLYDNKLTKHDLSGKGFSTDYIS